MPPSAWRHGPARHGPGINQETANRVCVQAQRTWRGYKLQLNDEVI